MSYASKLILKVINYNGSSIDDSIACEFGIGEQITVGRSAGNSLVLDDPSRLVSRVQASLSHKDTSSAVIKNTSSSTGIFIGAVELQPGESSVIHLSDTLMIGAYLLRLQQFQAMPAKTNIIDSAGMGAVKFLEAESFIPADFDFFAVNKPVEDAALFNASDVMPHDLDASNSLLDDLDELNSSDYSPDQQKGDDNDGLLHQECSVDPLALLSVNDKVIPEIIYSLDDGNEIESLFLVPRAINRVQPIHHPLVDPAEPVNITGAVNNFRDKTKQHTDKKKINEIEGDNNEPSDMYRRAFARGLQMDESKLPNFSPDFFEVLGGMLLQLTAGTVNMMHERAHIKHEMRADVTIIASSGNNPLKFAPDAQSALLHMIGERIPGFMHSVEAIDDAFDDLLAHQIGLMSGARAAVYEVVKNFSPEKIQKYMIKNNFIDSLLPMSKKAKLWELYETHYAEVAGNAREDFELRFQQAFSQAYEQEIDRMCEAREGT